ncbi:MAG: glycosyltransferase family 2 protein [Firmicutes bacterium]|nr:glycosyltransferase family 2 protein [Bacillota bacterium]
MIIAGLVTTLCGILAGLVLFFRHPFFDRREKLTVNPRVSVIIPARNEEANLAHLLSDLKKQTYQPFEVIVVDDASSDQTLNIATGAQVKTIEMKDKPDGWMGKNHACHLGVLAAQGDLYLFLDADVRLSAQALEKLLKTWQKRQGVISVQPYHAKKKFYESFSLYFNLIQIAANGLTNLFPRQSVSLFGPVILITKKDYETIGGHAAVKNCVVEDLALGQQLTKHHIPFHLYLGKKDITFRMYGGGLRQLSQGWIKNFATGAGLTKVFTMLLIVLWVACNLSLPFDVIRTLVTFNPLYFSIYAGLFVILWIELAVFSSRIGNHAWLAVVCYPLWMAGFLIIFIVSLYRRLFHRPVTWKDRKIDFH